MVGEVAVQGCHIPMRKIELDTEFSSYLPHVLLIPNLLLLHNFESAEEASLLMAHNHDLSELTLAELLPDQEIRFLELFQFGHRLAGLLHIGIGPL